MRRARRQLLPGGLALGCLGLLAGCELPRLPRQAARVARVGFLGVGSREGRAFLIEGLLQGLREQGYVEGRDILIEYRNDRLPALAAEPIDLRVDLIVASGSPASFAARDATATIPIVMGALAADPVETGLIASLARPGGNVTGMSMLVAQLGGKRLELLKEIVPRLARVAVFWNPPNPTYGPLLKELEAAAPTLGLELQRLEVRAPEDFEGAFAAATEQGAGALYAQADPLVTNRPGVVADLALRHRMPTITDFRELPAAGGLLSFGPNLAEAYRRAATHVDKILKGAKPAELPMEQATTFDLAINLGTARPLGLTVRASMLAQATEVIQ